MPNLIEYADLLKGLPDDRISTLMQNPTGEVPPFLVAAEAQRRQSIREQFSGGPQESVVDTLTKQLSKVPQNIQAPMQAPPQMPPPQMPPPQMPPQAGVAALPGGEGMRRGGMVQRYQDGSLVQRYYRYGPRGIGAPQPEPTDATLFDIFGGFFAPESSDAAPSGDLLTAPSLSEVERIAEERKRSEQILDESEGAEYVDPFVAAKRPALKTNPPNTNIVQERNPDAGTADTSYENKSASKIAEFRREMEKLYGFEEPSGAERAQKWFAMAAAFAQPGQSTAESIANAGLAFSTAAAQEKAQRVAAELAGKKAMLEFDIAQYEAEQKARADEIAYARELAKEQRANTRFSVKDQAAILSDQIESIRSEISKLDPMVSADQIKRLEADLLKVQGQYALLVNDYGGVDYSGLRTYNPDGTLTKN
jgi:hypothetical protein